MGVHPLSVHQIRIRAAVAIAVAMTLLAALPAAAAIIPGRGMARVALRMTEAQVQAELGAPRRITRTRGALGFVVTRLHYRRVDVDLQRLAARPVVIRVLTTKPGETTASGVGVGSSFAAVKQVRGVHCWRESGARYCGVGEREPLHPFTLFWIGANARVMLIEVSLNVNS